MDILGSITEVFDAIGTWITGAVNDMIPMFWNATDNTLTLLGTLAVVGLGFSVVFLLIGIIQRFLHFAG